MVSIIEEARRSFASTVEELHDEQKALSLTSDKISQSSLILSDSRCFPAAGLFCFFVPIHISAVAVIYRMAQKSKPLPNYQKIVLNRDYP